MTFTAICDVATLKAYFAPLSTIADECKINLSEDGFQTRVVDPAQVAMSSVTLDDDAFESYDADGGVIGLNIGRIEDVLGFGNAGDIVHLELNPETRKLEVDIAGLSYTLALIDPDSVRQEPDIPDLSEQLTADVRLAESDMGRGIKATDLVTDHIRFTADAEAGELHVIGEGDTDDVNLSLNGDLLLEGSTIDGDADSLFSLDYMSDISKAFPSGAELDFRIGEDVPLNLGYTDADGALSVEYMLAPRISGD